MFPAVTVIYISVHCISVQFNLIKTTFLLNIRTFLSPEIKTLPPIYTEIIKIIIKIPTHLCICL